MNKIRASIIVIISLLIVGAIVAFFVVGSKNTQESNTEKENQTLVEQEKTCKSGTICEDIYLSGEDFYYYPSGYDGAKPQHASDCQLSCMNNPKCQAWTFVRAGISGPDAICYEKTKLPKDISHQTTGASGAKVDFPIPTQSPPR